MMLPTLGIVAAMMQPDAGRMESRRTVEATYAWHEMDTESEVKSERMEEYNPVYGPTSHTDLSSSVCISINKN